MQKTKQAISGGAYQVALGIVVKLALGRVGLKILYGFF